MVFACSVRPVVVDYFTDARLGSLGRRFLSRVVPRRHARWSVRSGVAATVPGSDYPDDHDRAVVEELAVCMD